MRCERQQSREERSLCPQGHLSGHRMGPNLLTSRPVRVRGGGGEGACLNLWAQGSVTHSEIIRRGVPIMVTLPHSRKNLSSKVLFLTLTDLKGTLTCFIS